MEREFAPACPLPDSDARTIQLAHGGGGRLTSRLLEQVVVPAFRNRYLEARHDGAVLPVGASRLAFTTDTFVVQPHFFPGGDIGTLAVYGTVNDLAMCGAKPRWLSVALILEEGFPFESLRRVVESMRVAAAATGVEVVTGDTKVVDRGKGDGIFVNTAGIGILEHERSIAPASVRPGDAILVSGDLGRHGVAVLAVRAGLAFETSIESDCAPLDAPVQRLLEAGVEVHCLRDLTRGGLASAAVEIAEVARLALELDERAIPVSDGVRAACEILGLDPLLVANEGRFVAFVPQRDAARALALLQSEPVSSGACIVGRVEQAPAGCVTLRTALGTVRRVEMATGEQLPRIC